MSLSPFCNFRGEGVRSRGGEKYFVVGGSRDTCHARRRKRLVKEWQKKELDEEEWFSRKKQMEEKKKTREWLPPADNVTALKRQGRSIPHVSTQYMQVFSSAAVFMQ